jgi:hypothetical protein
VQALKIIPAPVFAHCLHVKCTAANYRRCCNANFCHNVTIEIIGERLAGFQQHYVPKNVNYPFLEVLPRLNPGVIVHVHDILFAFDYRRDSVMDEFRFWTEQYLLQTFPVFNSQFEVLVRNGYLDHRYLDDFNATFPTSPWWGGASFWMRRKLTSGK